MVRIVAKKVLWRLSHKRPMLLFEERYHLFRQTSEAGNTATTVRRWWLPPGGLQARCDPLWVVCLQGGGRAGMLKTRMG